MFFDDRADIRICQEDLKMIRKIIRKDKQAKYDNESHFIRAATIKLIREEKKRLSL